MDKKHYTKYLVHHGIKGQKWGVKNGPPYPLDPEDHNASERNAGWKKSLDSSGTTSPKSKKKVNKLVQVAYKHLEKRADKNYQKMLKKKETKNAVKKYQRAMDSVNKRQEKLDQEWERVQQKYESIAKTKIGRVIKTMKNSPEAKAYSKAYDSWNKKQEALDRDYNKAKALYAETGKNALARVLNNMRYGE